MDDPGHIEGVNTTTLMIVNVAVTDWGIYSCEASNIVNNVTSNGATLHGELCMTMSVHACVGMGFCMCVSVCGIVCVCVSV